MKKKTKKAVGYIRVSTSVQAKKGESLSTQRQQIVDYAKNNGWQLEHIYGDKGISGAKIEHRINFKKMLEDAKQGKFNVIVFTKLSRFARNTREFLNLFDELKDYGITLVSIKENFDPSTSTGKVIATILASFAEWERETIREQMLENKMARWREKRIFNGRPPYAYYWNKQRKQLEINEEEAEIYHSIVDMYLNQKMSFQDIVLKLKEDGIKCKRAYWSSTTISYTLKNPAYYGKYVVNKYIYEDGPNGAGTKRTKKTKESSEHISYPIPALISKNQWDKIQKQTKFNKLKSKRSNKTADLIMRDVLICGRCGGRVKPKIGNKKKDGSVPRYYACYWRSTSEKNLLASGRTKKCSLPYIAAKHVETAVWPEILILFHLNPIKAFDHLDDTQKHLDKMSQLKEKKDRLEVELNKKNIARNKLFEFMDIDTNINDLSYRLEKNQDEILSLESRINDTKLEYVELENLTKNKEDTKKFLRKHKKKLKQIIPEIRKLGYEDRKLLVEAMLHDKVIVDFQEDNEVDGPGGPYCDFQLIWNPDILERFANEGKITSLNQNSTFDSPRHEL